MKHREKIAEYLLKSLENKWNEESLQVLEKFFDEEESKDRIRLSTAKITAYWSLTDSERLRMAQKHNPQ